MELAPKETGIEDNSEHQQIRCFPGRYKKKLQLEAEFIVTDDAEKLKNIIVTFTGFNKMDIISFP